MADLHLDLAVAAAMTGTMATAIVATSTSVHAASALAQAGVALAALEAASAATTTTTAAACHLEEQDCPDDAPNPADEGNHELKDANDNGRQCAPVEQAVQDGAHAEEEAVDQTQQDRPELAKWWLRRRHGRRLTDNTANDATHG